MTTEPRDNHTHPLETDVPCPSCDYNLRGLSGDPVRCSECGAAFNGAYIAKPPTA